MKNHWIFQKILYEIERIQWEVEAIEKHASMMRNIAENIFQNKRQGVKKSFQREGNDLSYDKDLWKDPNGDRSSCVFSTNINKFSHRDKEFIRITEKLDSVFKALVENNHHILFAYIISKRGVTRGYPWKDTSVLPKGFDPTLQPFFFIADEKHNPQKKIKWTEPYLCPLMKTWMVTCSSPVWIDSHFLGVIGIDVNLGKIIEPMDQTLKMTEKGYAFLISPHGNLIISSDKGMNSLREDSIWIEGKQKDSRWKKNILKNFIRNNSLPLETQMTEIKLTSGKKYLFYRYFKATGWSLVTLLPKGRTEVTKKARPLRKKEALISSDKNQPDGVYLPLMGFISSFSRSLQQIEKLIEGTKMIGKGILNHRIKVRRKDEIGLLALSINKMAKELKKRKEEFESAYRKISQLDRLMAIGRLAAGVAHEINNPLGIISNYVQMLLKNPSLSVEIQKDLFLIEEEIHKTMEIIKGLLNFSRESEMEKNLIDLNEVLRRTVSLLRFQLKSQSIQLVEDYNENLPLILGDSNHLQQAFLNVLLNSIQAMPNGGKLGVKTAFHGRDISKKLNGRVVVEILDTGVGIDPKYLDKIFDPFFTTKERGSGTGLGLSISYGIIKEHKGNFDVKSITGEGTVVKIVFPVPQDS